MLCLWPYRPDKAQCWRKQKSGLCRVPRAQHGHQYGLLLCQQCRPSQGRQNIPVPTSSLPVLMSAKQQCPLCEHLAICNTPAMHRPISRHMMYVYPQVLYPADMHMILSHCTSIYARCVGRRCIYNTALDRRLSTPPGAWSRAAMSFSCHSRISRSAGHPLVAKPSSMMTSPPISPQKSCIT